LFTDADCEPVAAWLSRIVEPLERDDRVGGVRGAYCSRQTSLIARFTQVELDEKTASLRQYPVIDFLDTSSAAFRRTAFWALGGFDETLFEASNEDTLLSYGLVKCGWRLVLVEDARVHHRHPEGLRKYLARKWRHGYWRVRVYECHPTKLLGDTYTPRSLQVQFAAVVATLATLPFAHLRKVAALSGLAFALATYPFIRRALPRGWDVAMATPLLLLLRTLALGAGLASGLTHPIVRRIVAGAPQRRARCRLTGRRESR
jgi:GT2 family glycosyltransferase